MKNRVMKATVLLLLGMMLFASCKHAGFPVKNSAVQVPVTFEGEETKTYSIPVTLYDAIEAKFAEMAEKFNADTIITKEDIEAFDGYAIALYKLYVWDAKDFPEESTESVAKVVPEKKVKKVVKELAKLSKKEQDDLGYICIELSNLFDTPYHYLQNLAEVGTEEGYFESKEELVSFCNEFDKSYKEFFEIEPQFFPDVVFDVK